jgi:hypothetical protein
MPVYDVSGVHEIRRDLYFARGLRDAAALGDVLRRLGAGEGPVILKVNWFSGLPGQFTDAETLTLFCNAIAGEKVIVEGHACLRNDGSRAVTPANARASWDWMREQEAAYFARTGLDRVLGRDDVRYVNVTDEVWAGKTAPAADVRAALGEKALALEELYDILPACLLAYRGRPLISLARIKVPSPAGDDAFSLSLKNMFGLIPDPDRGAYHPRLPEAVTDVHLLYGAFFPIVGVCEGIFHVVRANDSGGAYEAPWGGRYDDLGALGVMTAGARPAAADAFTAALFGVDIGGRSLMKLAAQRLGPYDKMVALEARLYESYTRPIR